MFKYPLHVLQKNINDLSEKNRRITTCQSKSSRVQAQVAHVKRDRLAKEIDRRSGYIARGVNGDVTRLHVITLLIMDHASYFSRATLIPEILDCSERSCGF